MSPDVSGLPGEHRHGFDSAAYFRIDVEQAGIYLAVVENAVEEFPLLLRQVEQEGELFPAERNGLLDPRLDLSFECPGLVSGLVGEALQRPGGMKAIYEI